jgi:hypothetical protein
MDPDNHPNAKRIAALNDYLRKTTTGGKVHLTRGVINAAGDRIFNLMKAIADFDNFTGDNDPWKEHDCAMIEWEGTPIIWKIDYYNELMQYGSEDPSNADKTTRVMTVMLASEY